MLTSNQVNQYKEEGCCLCAEFLDEARVSRILKEIGQVSAGATAASVMGWHLVIAS